MPPCSIPAQRSLHPHNVRIASLAPVENSAKIGEGDIGEGYNAVCQEREREKTNEYKAQTQFACNSRDHGSKKCTTLLGIGLAIGNGFLGDAILLRLVLGFESSFELSFQLLVVSEGLF